MVVSASEASSWGIKAGFGAQDQPVLEETVQNNRKAPSLSISSKYGYEFCYSYCYDFYYDFYYNYCYDFCYNCPHYCQRIQPKIKQKVMKDRPDSLPVSY